MRVGVESDSDSEMIITMKIKMNPKQENFHLRIGYSRSDGQGLDNQVFNVILYHSSSFHLSENDIPYHTNDMKNYGTFYVGKNTIISKLSEQHRSPIFFTSWNLSKLSFYNLIIIAREIRMKLWEEIVRQIISHGIKDEKDLEISDERIRDSPLDYEIYSRISKKLEAFSRDEQDAIKISFFG